MSANPSNDFSYMYQLELVNGSFVLKDADNSIANGITPEPVGAGVSVNDNIVDPSFSGTDSSLLLGDAINDQFTLNVEGGPLGGMLNGTYSYVSLGLTSDNTGPTDTSHTGFIAQSGTNYYYITNNLITISPTASQSALTLTTESGDVAICFMPETHIRTPGGETVVQDLKIGDLVETHEGRSLPVIWIGRQTVAGRFADASRLPIRIREGALGPNIPCRDLLVSPDHALFVDGVLINANALVNNMSIIRERNVPPIFTYYHIELGDHSLVLAENTPAESFVDNVDRANFDNWREYQSLYPDGNNVPEMSLPRAKASRQVPRKIRDRLSERGMDFYGSRVGSAA
jgi:Hint domain